MVNDIVRDILRRVVEAAQHQGGFDEAMALQIEMQIRRDWGGARANVAHNVEQQRIERNEKIQDVWDNGNHDLKMLAQRFGLSEKQVRRIVGR